MRLLKKINNMLIYECDDKKEMAEIVGNKVIAQVKYKPDSNIALQSGYSIVPTCKYLISRARKLKISFRDTKFYAVSEYGVVKFGAQMTHKSFMQPHFYKPLKIKDKHINYPNKDNENYDFSRYDRWIWTEGGIDLAIISVGITGELGFNSAGTSFDSLTHCVKLPRKVIMAEANFYQTSENLIPKVGITMGIYTIYNCRHIILIASGEEKSEPISKLFRNERTEKWPLTSLLRHHNIEVYVDKTLVKGLSKYIKNI